MRKLICILKNFLAISLMAIFISLNQLHNVAAAEYNIQLQPATSHFITKPGTEIIKKFTLTNFGDPTLIKLSLNEVRVKNSKGELSTLPISEEISGILKIQTTDPTFPLDKPFLLKSNEAIDFELKLQIETDAPPQDIYLSLFAESDAYDSFKDNNSIVIDASLGSLILITITNETKIEERIDIAMIQPENSRKISFLNQDLYLTDTSTEDANLSITISNNKPTASYFTGQIKNRSFFNQEKKPAIIEKQIILSQSQKIIDTTDQFYFSKGSFNFSQVEVKILAGASLTEAKKRVNILSFSLNLLIPAFFLFFTALTLLLLVLRRFLKKTPFI
jgi:hypothetical protein